MKFLRKNGICVLVLALCSTSCVSCNSMLHSRKLPITVAAIDATTEEPVSGATVELQWRTGFQGYYWGKPVKRVTDSTGKVNFASKDVPPVSSDGYSLGKDIKKLFVSAILVSANGYEKAVLRNPENEGDFEVLLNTVKGGGSHPKASNGGSVEGGRL